VDLEPNYAPAWAGLAEATFAEGDDSNSVAEYSTMTQKALAAADKAITLGPDLAEGFAVRGYIRSWGQWDFQGAADDFRRALVLEPDNPYVLSKYSGSVLMPIGQLDESVAAVEKALKLDPLNADSWRRLGIQQFYRGDQRAAQEALQRSLEINPEQSITAAYLAFTYLLLREPSSALPMSQRATSEAFRLQGAALAEHDLGHAKVAQQQLDDLIAKYEVGAADQIAEVYAWRGDTSQAFEWLEKAYLQHDTALTMVKVDPLLRSLRPDPRYAALLEKMKLQDQRPLY
jgi:serine/threonine-protein kinase